MKKMLFILIFLTSTTVADWLDDMVKLVIEKDALPAKQVEEIIQRYIKQDKEEIATVEKQESQNANIGFWASLRGATFQAQMLTAEASLKYHEAVEKFLRELAENKKDREIFVSELKKLHNLEKELETLKAQYDPNARISNKLNLGTKIAAKQAEITARRAYLKTVKPR